MCRRPLDIQETGHAQSDAVENALRAVARHLYLPDTTLTDAYANIAVTIKCGAEDTVLS